MLQACLNGPRPRGDHSAVPLTPEELAADARRAIAAGAAELHVHARVPGGRDTTEPGAAGATVRAIRAACPGVPLGLTTGLWTTDGDAELRHAQVEAWEDLPDYVSVNLAEPGSAELCELLRGRGVGIEAGVWNLADALTAPQLHHGAGADAWEMLDAALARGRDVRIGLEDATLMPDGSTARDNAELVAEAARRLLSGTRR